MAGHYRVRLNDSVHDDVLAKVIPLGLRLGVRLDLGFGG
jgi:hypothetical protein